MLLKREKQPYHQHTCWYEILARKTANHWCKFPKTRALRKSTIHSLYIRGGPIYHAELFTVIQVWYEPLMFQVSHSIHFQFFSTILWSSVKKASTKIRPVYLPLPTFRCQSLLLAIRAVATECKSRKPCSYSDYWHTGTDTTGWKLIFQIVWAWKEEHWPIVPPVIPWRRVKYVLFSSPPKIFLQTMNYSRDHTMSGSKYTQQWVKG